MRKTGEVRQMLIDALEKATQGKLPPEDARSISSLAGQISQSMAVEIKVLAMKMRLEQVEDIEGFGELEISGK